jgi:hypothetical protein
MCEYLISVSVSLEILIYTHTRYLMRYAHIHTSAGSPAASSRHDV